MKPKQFDYLRAGSVDEAVAELAETGEDAKILAGGQSLMAMLNFRLAEPEVLVDIANIEALSYIRKDGDMVEIGAATTQGDLQDWDGLPENLNLLHKAFPNIGHFQTRNRGTVCGSVAHADPSTELPLCLATLGGEVVLRSKKGERKLNAADFQLGMLTTARRADELVAAVRYPVSKPGAGYGFREVARRRGDFAIVALAASAVGDTVRLGIGGVADKPTVREWTGLADSDLDDALNAFAWELGGYDDIHATSKYRRKLVRKLGRRVIEEAKSCQS